MKRRSILQCSVATLLCTGILAMSVYAGSWIKNTTGWWYDYGNGTWPSSSWQWIDGNNDGVAECYYFDRFGYCMINATTPDGYQVNGSGAWVENGIVQTRNVGGSQVSGAGEEAKNETNYTAGRKNKLSLFNTEPIIRSGVRKMDSLASNRENKSFTNCLMFVSDDLGEYIEFDNSAGYTHLKATVFPVKDFWGEGNRMLLQVLSGEDDEIYSTQDIYYDTKAFDIDVDITGYEKVRLKAVRVSQYRLDIAVANARFE